MLIVDRSATQRLDGTTLTAEKEFAISFSEEPKKFCLGLHYNDSYSYFLLANVKIYKFKAKDFVWGYVYDFLIDYNSTDVADILDIAKYLVTNNNMK